MDGWRRMILLMVSADEDEERMESWEEEDADEERRKEVLSLEGEKRAVMVWKRVVCMIAIAIAIAIVGVDCSIERVLSQEM